MLLTCAGCNVAGKRNVLLHLFEMLQNLNFIFYLAVVNIWVSEFCPLYAGAYWDDIFKLEFSKICIACYVKVNHKD